MGMALALIPGSSSRPADVYLPVWSRGQPAALDVTVISPMQQLTMSGASVTAGHALSVAENRKLVAHASTCRGIFFIPLAVETFGGWSQLVGDTIKSIGRQQGQRLGIPPPGHYSPPISKTSHLIVERECFYVVKKTKKPTL